MTTIEKIGQFTIARAARRGLIVAIDAETGDREVFTTRRAARQAVLERVDLDVYLEATVH